MAKATISDDELQLKKRARRRLGGAVAPVLLIVVFLPMILDSGPKPLHQDIAITIPPIPKPESAPQIPTPPPAVPGTTAPPRVTGLPEGNAAVQPEPAPSVEARPELPKSEPPGSEAKSDARQVPKPVTRHEVKPAPPSHAAAGDES